MTIYKLLRTPTGLLAFLAIALLLSGLSPILHPQSATPPVRMGNGTTTGDLVLYRDIGQAVRAGQPYYRTATRLQRLRDYPVRPFLTVRPPTLAWVYALVGPGGMIALALVTIAASSLLWYRRLADRGWIERLGAPAILSVVGALGLDGRIVFSHEWWSGLLLSCSLAVPRERGFYWQLGLAVLATLVRELAALFLVLMLIAELQRRNAHRAGCILACLAGLVLLLALHRAAVMAVLLPGDRASPGWLGLRGLYGLVDDLALLTGLHQLWQPARTLLILLPIGGWLRQLPEQNQALAWLVCFAAIEGVCARPDNFYWAQMLLPVYALGLVFYSLPYGSGQIRGVSRPAGQGR